TALTSEADVYLKHFYDSISAAFYYDFNEVVHICDVGAGAGFPSIPLKICFPHLHISIVDSLNKRIGFLNHLADQLELDNVTFYVLMDRSVARMFVLSDLCLPLSKIKGSFIAMKGAQANEELADAGKAIQTLGGKVSMTQTFSLPQEDSERSIVIVNKDRKT